MPDQNEFKFPDEQDGGTPAPEDKLEVEVEAEAGTEVEVVDDTPEQDRGRKPMETAPEEVTDEELATYSEGVKKRIQRFTKGYHDERRAKESALREREEALALAKNLLEENRNLKGTVGQSQNALLEQAKRVVESELTDAKRALKEALDNFDNEAIAEANAKIAQTAAKLERVNNIRPAPVQQKESAVQQAPSPAPLPAAPAPDPKATAWQDANPWFGTDDEMTAVALTVHRKLIEQGVNPTSDEYYGRINARMKQVFPSAFSPEKPARKSPVAPATRSTAPRKIVLTQSQAAVAKSLGIGLEDYARQVAILSRQANG
jgi:hypothetical protein